MNGFKNLSVTLTAVVQPYLTGLQTASARTRQFGAEVSAMSAKHGVDMKSMGRAAVAVGATFALALGAAGAAALSFEAAMRNVNSIAHETEGQFTRTSQQVVALSRDLPQGATELAEGLYDVVSSGFQGADALNVLEESARAATAGLTQTAVAGKGISAVLNAYGMSAGAAADVSDVLFQTVNLGVLTFGELTSGIGDWIGTAAAAGVAFDEASSALAAMTLSGIGAAEAGTSLNRVMQTFVDPSADMVKMLQSLGYESGVSAIQQDGLRGVMDRLRVATGGNIEVLAKLFPEIRAARGALALMANDGANYARVAGEITDENARAGATQRAFNEQSKSASFQLKLMWTNLQALGIELGSTFLPAIRLGASIVKTFAQTLSTMPGPVKAAVVIFGTLVAVVGLVGGAFLLLAPRIVATQAAMATMAAEAPAVAAGLSAITRAAGVIGLALTAVVAVTAAFGKAKAEAADRVKAFTEALRAENGALGDNVQKVLEQSLASHNQVDDLRRAKVGMDEVRAAMTGSANDFTRLIRKIDDHGQANFGLVRNLVKQREAFRESARDQVDYLVTTGKVTEAQVRAAKEAERHAVSQSRLEDTLRGAQPVFETFADDIGGAADAGVDYEAVLRRLSGSTEENADKTKVTAAQQAELDKMFGETGSAADDAAKAIDGMNDSLDDLLGRFFSVEEANDAATQAIYDLTDSIMENGTTLDGNTDKALANRGAMRDLADSLVDVIRANYEQGVRGRELADVIDLQRQRFVAVAGELGFTQDQVQVYLDLLDEASAAVVDPDLKTDKLDAANKKLRETKERLEDVDGYTAAAKVTVDDSQARTAIDGLRGLLANISSTPITPTVRPRVQSQGIQGLGNIYGPATGRAAGGPVAPAATYIVGEAGPELLEIYGAGWVYPATHPRTTAAVARQHGGAVGAAETDEIAHIRAERASHEAESAKQSQATAQKAADDAQKAADEAARAADEALQKQRGIEDAMYETGVMGAQQYLGLLEHRLAGEEAFTDQWLDAWHKRKSIYDEIAAYERAVAEEHMKVNDNLYRLGLMSDAQRVAILEKRLSHERKFSDEWTRIEEERLSIMARVGQEHQAIHDAEYETGAMAASDYLAILDKRLAREQKYSAEWVAIWKQRQQLLDEVAADEIAKLDSMADAWESAFDDALSTLSNAWITAKDQYRQQADDYARAVAERNEKIAEEITRFRDAVADPVRDLGDLIGTFGRAGEAVSGDEIVAMLEHRVEAASRWGETMRQLSTSGLQRDLVTQLAQAGPEALGLAEALRDMDPEQINDLLGQLDTMGTGLGDLFATQEDAAIRARVAAESPLPAMQSFNDLLAEEIDRQRDARAEREQAAAWAQSMVGTYYPALRGEADAWKHQLDATTMSMQSQREAADRLADAYDRLARSAAVAGGGPGAAAAGGLSIPVSVTASGVPAAALPAMTREIQALLSQVVARYRQGVH